MQSLQEKFPKTIKSNSVGCRQGQRGSSSVVIFGKYFSPGFETFKNISALLCKLSIMLDFGVAPNLHFPHLHQTLIYTHPTFTPDPNLHKPRFTPDPNLHKPRFTQTHFWTYISINPNLHNPNLHKTQIYTTQIYTTQIYTKIKKNTILLSKFTQN